MNIIREAVHAKILPNKSEQNRTILVGTFVLATLTLCIGITVNAPNVSVLTVTIASIILGAGIATGATLAILKVEAIIEHFMA